MTDNLGDFVLGGTYYCKFTTPRFSTGAPFTLVGGVVAAYADDSITQITAGLTLTVDFDGVPGLQHVTIAATNGNGYLTATDYMLVLTAGTVDGVSWAGRVIGYFSIENRLLNRAKLAPDTALQTPLSGTAQAGGANTITLPVSASAVDNAYNGNAIQITGGLGFGQNANIILSYVGATRVATMTDAWIIVPDATTTIAMTPAQETGADIATALLDLANGVEIGLTLRNTLRLLAAACAGILSGGGTPTEILKNAVANNKNRMTATVDASGNRSAIVYDFT